MTLRPSLTLFIIAATLMTSAMPASAQTGDIQAGQAVYAAQMCSLCHSRAGESGPMAHVGGPLDGLASRRDAAWIEGYLRDPKSVIPNSQMPKTGLTDQELADLIAFLLAP